MGIEMYGYQDEGDAITGSVIASNRLMLDFIIWAWHVAGPRSSFLRLNVHGEMYASFRRFGNIRSPIDEDGEDQWGDLDELRTDLERIGSYRADFPYPYDIVFDRIWETVRDSRVTVVRVT